MKSKYRWMIGGCVLAGARLTMGCMTAMYRPDEKPDTVRTMTPSAARTELQRALDGSTHLGMSGGPRQFTLSFQHDGVQLHAKKTNGDAERFDCLIRYDDVKTRQVYTDNMGDYFADVCGGTITWMNSKETSIQYADALYVLSSSRGRDLTEAVASLDDFQKIADEYRASGHHEFPEEAHRYRALAEAAFKEKDYTSALENYRQALALAPWWPEGHYNRGLLLGQEGSYAQAVVELKKFLMLVPEAPNARSAKDKIYVWEAKR